MKKAIEILKTDEGYADKRLGPPEFVAGYERAIAVLGLQVEQEDYVSRPRFERFRRAAIEALDESERVENSILERLDALEAAGDFPVTEKEIA